MYRCPPEFDKDGLPIDFRSPDLDISECLRAVRASGIKYDAILVDPFHEYQPSARDIRDAFGLLAPAGTMIVHDCFPREEKIAGPDYVKGEWCGVTYKAYLDFVLARRDLIFCTVDTDYGCGVVRYDAALPLSQRLGRRIEFADRRRFVRPTTREPRRLTHQVGGDAKGRARRE